LRTPQNNQLPRNDAVVEGREVPKKLRFKVPGDDRKVSQNDWTIFRLFCVKTPERAKSQGFDTLLISVEN